MNKTDEIDMSVIRYDKNNPITQVTLITEFKQSRFRFIEMIRQLLSINIPKGRTRIYNGEPVSGHASFETYQAYDVTIDNAINKRKNKI